MEKLSLIPTGIPQNILSTSGSFKFEAISIASFSKIVSKALLLSSFALLIASNVNSSGVIFLSTKAWCISLIVKSK